MRVAKRRKVNPQGTTTTARSLVAEEARLLAAEALAQLATRGAVIALVRQQFPTLSPVVAGRVVDEAAELLRAPITDRVDQLRSIMVARTEALYRRALRGEKLSTCVELLKLQAKIFGVESPQQHHHTGTVAVVDPLESRSEAELDHYLAHGCWPEEVRVRATPQLPKTADSDPLAILERIH